MSQLQCIATWSRQTLRQLFSATSIPGLSVSVAQWARPLNRPRCLLAWRADGSCRPWVQIQVWNGVFQLQWTSGQAMRLNSRTGIEDPPVSSLNCGLWLRLQSWLMPQSLHRLQNDLTCVKWDVTWRNSIRNFSEIEQSAAELKAI